MKIFFRIHNYSKNMKSRIATFILKGKDDILWEYLRNIKAIKGEDFENNLRNILGTSIYLRDTLTIRLRSLVRSHWVKWKMWSLSPNY